MKHIPWTPCTSVARGSIPVDVDTVNMAKQCGLSSCSARFCYRRNLTLSATRILGTHPRKRNNNSTCNGQRARDYILRVMPCAQDLSQAHIEGVRVVSTDSQLSPCIHGDVSRVPPLVHSPGWSCLPEENILRCTRGSERPSSSCCG